MPKGYDTEVGERGTTLSGRAKTASRHLPAPYSRILRILLLDDATSSVDTETERQIQIALETLMQGRTSFVIAQRLSTVRMADVVLVLDRGRIAAQGTHEELLESSGLYAEIYHRNLRVTRLWDFSIGSASGNMGSPRGAIDRFGDKVEGKTFNPNVVLRLLKYIRPI